MSPRVFPLSDAAIVLSTARQVMRQPAGHAPADQRAAAELLVHEGETLTWRERADDVLGGLALFVMLGGLLVLGWGLS